MRVAVRIILIEFEVLGVFIYSQYCVQFGYVI